MRKAILVVTGKLSGRSFWITLYYNYSPGLPDTWWCLPGYLGATSGTWRSSGLVNDIKLYDPDRELVADDMDVQYLGYPFDGLDDDKGPFSIYARGSVLYNDNNEWEFLFV